MPAFPNAPTPQGNQSALNITAATVIKAGPGVVVSIGVLVVGTSVGTVNDCLTTGAAAVTNQVAPIPEAVGTYAIGALCATGIVVVPGTGQTLAVMFA